MADERDHRLVVRTGERDWLATLAKAYSVRQSLLLVDDAGLGVDPVRDTLLQMGRKAHLGVPEWAAVLVALGMAATGAHLLWKTATRRTPSPVALLTALALVLGGGFTAVRVLTGLKPPNVRLSARGDFEIDWG